NSSLYYCCTLSFSSLGLRYDSLVPYRAAAPSRRGRPTFASYAGLKLSKNFRPTPQMPFLRGENGCKGTTFFIIGKLFRNFFFQKFFSRLIISGLQRQKKSRKAIKTRRDAPKRVSAVIILNNV
ncbi:MAG: hypothetical protein J6P73_09925, partial [Bacteroidales bacterium]|nr:hypothetical protein [Bacteroidales bacterium]